METCPACADNRIHTAEEKKKYHPLSGHGYTKEQGWTFLESFNRIDEIITEANREEIPVDKNDNPVVP